MSQHNMTTNCKNQLQNVLLKRSFQGNKLNSTEITVLAVTDCLFKANHQVESVNHFTSN